MSEQYSDTAYYKRDKPFLFSRAIVKRICQDAARDYRAFVDVAAPWDGITMVRATLRVDTVDPASLLQTAITDCTPLLHACRYRIMGDCTLNAQHLRLIPEVEQVALFPGDRVEAWVPMAYELGGCNVGVSTDDFLANLRNPSVKSRMVNKVLEPSHALYAITDFLAQHVQSGSRMHPPFFAVDCAGAQYSPGGDGKFNDVPRWDVYPPSGTNAGLVYLNWNWSRRSRPFQGPGLGRDLRVPV